MTRGFKKSSPAPRQRRPTNSSGGKEIHGDDNRNVSFQQTTDLVEKLPAQNVAFEELIILDEIHDLLRWSDWDSNEF